MNEKTPVKMFRDTMLQCATSGHARFSTRGPFQSVKHVVLYNNDRCSVGNWVMARQSRNSDTRNDARPISDLPTIGKVMQILRGRDQKYAIVVQRGDYSAVLMPYAMPAFSALQEYFAYELSVSSS